MQVCTSVFRYKIFFFTDFFPVSECDLGYTQNFMLTYFDVIKPILFNLPSLWEAIPRLYYIIPRVVDAI